MYRAECPPWTMYWAECPPKQVFAEYDYLIIVAETIGQNLQIYVYYHSIISLLQHISTWIAAIHVESWWIYSSCFTFCPFLATPPPPPPPQKKKTHKKTKQNKNGGWHGENKPVFMFISTYFFISLKECHPWFGWNTNQNILQVNVYYSVHYYKCQDQVCFGMLAWIC